MLQNATPLRKSAPGPPNISDKHVSCIAPATENASLQILFKCPTPAIVFGNATKPSRFTHFDKVHNPLRLPRQSTSERPNVVRTHSVFNILTSKCASRHIATSKSGPNLVCFVHFDFEICFAAQRRALFRHLLPKVVRAWCVLHILTSKCASRHNGVHFFDIATSLRATTACNFSSLIWPAGSAAAALASLPLVLAEPQNHWN